MRDHPENDLHSGADRFSRVRPEPQTFDELADEPDPLVTAERNRQSTRQAIWYAVATVGITVGFGFVLALISRLQGGPLCDDGATWLCTPQWRTWWAILTSIPPVAMLIGCAVIMVRKLNRYERWMPWMGVFWLPIVPFTMIWLIITVGILAFDATEGVSG
ncbi:hypothetical protein CGLAU_11960 [Corynebacterium glaucum]|uniref:Uncharacterized protein n=1 Tax=Corynebacterium glaucum TaxID=187491 RepID=A0A1Q2HZW4_9CORY|nr:hypothetical protein [Corynebacterium glaucum]AQQ16320.1 hypothetical protein CGLAU_11960 [Corynebacterium glaucum]WJZ08822.1 hypothetical protein CGLAUT_11850 [Corynebacterium glaucum]